jgi:hypothetical protein
VLRLHAERDGHNVVVDFAIATTGSELGGAYTAVVDAGLSSSANSARFAIAANELTVGTFEVQPEKLFDTTFPFEAVAAANADSDGTITASELRAVRVAGLTATYASDLYDALNQRLTWSVFKVRGP